jgi:DUF4097 and DUF4098 domain-containing protein YvlB
MQTWKFLCASLVVLLWLAPGCSLVNTQRRDESFTISGPARLEGEIGISRLVVQGANTDQIRIQATLRQARQTAYRTVQSDSAIRIEVDTAANITSSAGQPAVEIVATVPEMTEVELTSSTGDIYIDEIAGRIALTTSSGSLQLSDCRGHIELHNQTGTTESRRVDGSFLIRSAAGNVILHDVGGTFDIETGSSDIDLEGEFAEGQDHLLVSSTGAITVATLGSANLRLHVASESGLVRCLLTMRQQSITNHSCAGILGSGAGKLQIRTSTGRVTVQ